MDLSGIIKESGITNSIQIGSRSGQEAFLLGLYKWSRNPAEIYHRSNKLRSFRSILQKNPSLSNKIKKFYDNYSKAEKTIEEIIQPQTEESKESKSQLVFTHTDLRPLNFAPLLLTILYFVKILITPAFAILMPLILIIAPFIMIKYMYKMDITFNYYWDIIQGLIFKQSATMMDKMQRIGHLGWVVAGIGQSMIQPVMTAKHVYSLNKIYSEYYTTTCNLYLEWKDIVAELKYDGWITSDKSYAGWFNTFCKDPRKFLAGAMEPLGLKCWICEISNMQVLYYLATNEYVNDIYIKQSSIPYLSLMGAFDPQIDPEKRKLININSLQNSLLTGPNRGGKSTVLRSVLINVLLAQTYGCCLAKKMCISPFDWIHTCLRLEDIPGSQSFFEREVFMAARSLKRLSDISYKGLILIDELFHSTNPSDSNRAAKIYTNQLWSNSNCISLISTHDFDLVRNAPDKIIRLCCPATINDDNSINYSYTLSTGICEVSSVDEILLEKGVA
jgi:hypothetical protein